MTSSIGRLVFAFAVIAGIILYLELSKVGIRVAPSTEVDISATTTLENQSAATATGTSSSASAMPAATSSVTTTVQGQPSAPSVPAQGVNTDAASRIVEKAKQYERAKEISTPDGFINVPSEKQSLALSELVGKKVILIDFWTYSCINCQRTTPYLNAWYEKYRNAGLEIVGIHTPEFDFEKIYDNVLAAVKKEGIKFPVVLDNDYSTWTSYQNRFWPRKYLIDIDGFIIFDHIGEGGYQLTELQIQRALAERALVLKTNVAVPGGVAKPDSSGEAGYARSPETYFGSSRNELLGNGQKNTPGTQTFETPSSPSRNTLYLGGAWNLSPEYAESVSAAKIVYRYQGKNVYLVGSAPSPVRVRVLRDGIPVGAEAGDDVRDGMLTVGEDRLYKVIAEPTLGEHTLELIIESPGLRAFTFTFG